MLENSVRVCSNINNADSNYGYLCVVRPPFPIEVSIVFTGSQISTHIDDVCALLLGEPPLHAYAVADNTYIVLEVRVYDPWTG